MNLSFSGCGFMGIYHVGVASAIREYAPQLFIGQISGASAGALAACGLITNSCLGQATSDVLKIVIQARAGALGPLRPSFNIVRVLRQGLLRNLPPDAHKICNGRLNISLTRFSDGKNVLVSQFDTLDDLVQALICSMFIPFYCGAIPPTYKGERYIDGGWSDNMPTLDENTITVSPFSGESDICPQDSESASFLSFDLRNTNVRFTARNIYRIATALFPPHPEIMSEMCRQGFEDALRYLARNDLISCTRCIAIRSSIALTKNLHTGGDDLFMSDTDEETIHSPSVDEITAATTPATPSAAVSAKKARTAALIKTKSAPRIRTRTLRSMSNIRKAESRALSDTHMHHSDDTECESCRQAARIAAGKGLPKIVRDTLANAEAGERTLFMRILRLAPIKWLRYLAVPWLLPLDVSYALCRKFLEWLPSLSDDAKWLIDRATEAIRFILSEIEAHKQLYATRFTCQMAITELNYSSMLFGSSSPAMPSTPPASTAQLSAPPPPISRRTSVVADTASLPKQWTVAEGNIGFSVDMSPRNQRVREMANIVETEDKRVNEPRSKFAASRVAYLADGLGLEGLQKAVGDGASPRSTSMENLKQDDLDAFASILAFTRRQEALMAYYYLDENNQMKVTEIYGVHHNDNDRVASFSRSCSRRQSIKETSGRPRSARDDSGVSGVSAPELEAAILAKVPGAAAGYRRQQNGKERKESTPGPSGSNGATSSGSAGVQRSASFPKHRRSSISQASMSGSGTGKTNFAGGTLSGRSKTITFVSPISTGSESEEAEKLFVPERRRPDPNSEFETAAYEPEDSSGDE